VFAWKSTEHENFDQQRVKVEIDGYDRPQLTLLKTYMIGCYIEDEVPQTGEKFEVEMFRYLKEEIVSKEYIDMLPREQITEKLVNYGYEA